MNITNSVHPEYFNAFDAWEKFRYIKDGGDSFIEKYLQRYSAREDVGDFTLRKTITPVPGFASGAVIDIKNAIFQRMSDISREGGSLMYQDVISSKFGGVDLRNATMNYFIGNRVLPELLFMGKVGVYVDMPVIDDKQTISQNLNKHPYFYVYKVEDIRNWRLAPHNESIEFEMLLLKETILTYDEVFSLPEKDNVRYRLLTQEGGAVIVKFYNETGAQIDSAGNPTTESTELKIKKIPFTLFEMDHSLLQNIANHQIALLNLESSDIGYSLKSNFPFYIEQQDRIKSAHLKGEGSEQVDNPEVTVGGAMGRSYAKGSDPPSFINPSPEPLTVSMEKQGKLKDDIRSLVQLALSAIQPKYASKDAKEFDEHGLESGLSFIGLILEHGERQLASFFAEYENSSEIPSIHYPERYSLKSDADRLNEAKDIHEVILTLPSKTAQKALTKLMVRKLLDTKILQKDLETIFKEIDDAKYTTTDPDVINIDLEKGLVSTETASEARGYDSKVEVPKAKAEHAERVKRIQDSQSPRGIDDLGTDDNAADNEKGQSQNSDINDDSARAVRGKQKEN